MSGTFKKPKVEIICEQHRWAVNRKNIRLFTKRRPNFLKTDSSPRRKRPDMLPHSTRAKDSAALG